MRNPYYHSCPLCGANLDPGERCTCTIEGSDADWTIEQLPQRAALDPTECNNFILDRLNSREGA